MSLDLKSMRCLDGVHGDLVKVVERACEIVPFRVTEGLRTAARQKQLVAQGKSRTMNSRHLTGHAVDLVDPAGSYDDAKMREIAAAMKQAADELGVPITWGGDWTKFCDTPHFELEWHAYPAGTMASKIKSAVAGAAAGTGGVVAVPQAPQWISNTVSTMESNIALTSRAIGLAKGVLTFELASMIGLVGLVVAIGCLFIPTGGQNADGSD